MTLSVEELPTGVEDFSLAQAFAGLADLYEKVDAHAASIAPALDLLCHAGCSACCRDSVFVTPLEALFMLHHMQRNLSAPDLAATVARGTAVFATNRERVLQFGHVECPGAPPLDAQDLQPRPRPLDRVLAARALSFDCPLLDEAGRCTIYAAREMRARLFGLSRLKSRDEYYACQMMGQRLEGRDVKLMDAEAVMGILKLYPLTAGEQVIPYYLWRYAPVLTNGE
jgi:Fe-S-cluster containining protein